MDFAQLTPYLVAANFVLTWGIGFYVHLTSKNKAITDRLDAMERALSADLNDHAQRIARMEANAVNAPTHNDLSKLHDKVNHVADSCSRMEGKMDGLDSNQRLMLSRVIEKKD